MDERTSQIWKTKKTWIKSNYNITVKIFRLNLEFLPKDLLYNDLNYNEATKNMLDSLNILEKAKKTKIQIENKQNYKKDQDDVWTKIGDFFNPFKCGKN